MKPFIKYPITVIVLLLIGYTQLFAQLNRGIASQDLGKSRTVLSQAGKLIPANETDIIFQESSMEEEDDRISTDLPVCHFIYAEVLTTDGLSSLGSRGKYVIHHSSSTEPWILFRVFRL